MDEERPPRTGGTIERPGRLYLPGVGTCPVCGERNLLTVAGGRLGSHLEASGGGRTCTGWGRQAVQP